MYARKKREVEWLVRVEKYIWRCIYDDDMPAAVCSEFIVRKQINYNGSGPDVITSVFANDIETTGNVIVGTDLYAVGNVKGRYLSGNGYLISGIVATSVPSSVNADVTGNVTATYVSASGNIVATSTLFAGNIAFNAVRTIVDDPAAATAGIPVGGIYANVGVLQVRRA